ncbi:voltage-dependent N-type calcium channel subunit alpha-1B-like [Globicephala melas]|uniref:voltage-dependent N-type calcium channel subunit alpha-1B-like n=1 Tax=Globicephala melas TaxID=9731 RepID=UPI00293D3C8F|nr:voltage-dependent N-type calcium channel subunit alpha-1B-like [Globicephala melas]
MAHPTAPRGQGRPPGDGPAGCRRERRQERGRSQERRQPSASSEKQRFYSCDRFGGREPPQPQPSLSSHPASPTAGQEPGPPRQGSASANGSPLLPTSGASTPGRGGRRQLPQTPLTLRPSVAYKTANSSPVHFAGAQTSLPAFSPGRLSRGLSEHNALLQRDPSASPWPPALGSAPTRTWGGVWTARLLPAPNLRTRSPSRRPWPPTRAARPGLPTCPP